MSDDDLDDLILGRLHRRRGLENGAGERTLRAADLAVFLNEPEERIQGRLRALADAGRVEESGAAPDRWMIVLSGDPGDR